MERPNAFYSMKTNPCGIDALHYVRVLEHAAGYIADPPLTNAIAHIDAHSEKSGHLPGTVSISDPRAPGTTP